MELNKQESEQWNCLKKLLKDDRFCLVIQYSLKASKCSQEILKIRLNYVTDVAMVQHKLYFVSVILGRVFGCLKYNKKSHSVLGIWKCLECKRMSNRASVCITAPSFRLISL